MGRSGPLSNTWFLDPTRAQNGTSIGSAVSRSSRQSVPILYNAPPFLPSELPLLTGIWTPSNTRFLGLSEPITLTASRSVQPFLHSSPQTVPILCNGRPPSKLPLPMGASEPNLTHGSLSQLELITQMAFRSVQPFLQCSRL